MWLDFRMDFLWFSVTPQGLHIPESPLTLFLIPTPQHQEMSPVNSSSDLSQGPYHHKISFFFVAKGKKAPSLLAYAF